VIAGEKHSKTLNDGSDVKTNQNPEKNVFMSAYGHKTKSRTQIQHWEIQTFQTQSPAKFKFCRAIQNSAYFLIFQLA
jgi:hypothetical protein